MAHETGKRHVVLLFAVLAGLFLMHGLSAGGVAGCHGATAEMVAVQPMRGMPADPAMHADPAEPADPAMRSESAMPSVAAGWAGAQMPTAVGDPDPMADHAHAGETCIPLRPEGLSGLFLALFLIVITLWRPRLPRSACLIRPYWPHGPPRSGVQVLRTLSVSRT